MSNRYNKDNRNEHRSSSKNLKKFVPKRDLQTPETQRKTLSDSLRSSSDDRSGPIPGDVVYNSRVTIGENGEWATKTSEGGSFVVYLPQDEAVAAGLGPDQSGWDPVESQYVVDLLNRELSRLLKSSPKNFWREVATDKSLSVFLESFLKFRNRWYDFPHRGAQGIVAGIIVGEFELCRRVFLVLYRLSSNRDPGAKASDTLSLKDHAAILQREKWLDLPKLLDICAIYGHENEDLSRILVMNALKAQPHIEDDFPVLMSHFLSIIKTMNQRCISALEILLSGDLQDVECNRLLSDYLEVMDFINDSVVSMDSFVNAYNRAAVFFSSSVEISDESEDLLVTLSELHDSLLPSLQRGFHVIYGTTNHRSQETSQQILSNVSVSLNMLSTRITAFGWKLLYFCYLGDEVLKSGYSPALTKMFPANVEDPLVRADILFQSLKNITGNFTHIAEEQSGMTFIQRIEKNHNLMDKIISLQSTGWMSMDNEQFQFLSRTMKLPLETDIKVKNSSIGKEMQTDENAAITESKISQIVELFPNYGRGFLLACLEAYNQDPEEVIQRILEGTLHEDLQSLDITLDRIPSPITTPSVSRNDKGKGKLVDTTSSLSDTVVMPSIVKSEAGFSSGSSSTSVGRFIRKNTDKLFDYDVLDSKKDKEMEKTVSLISQLEYEDEYDDSFDDLGLSICDSVLEESETLENKMNSQKGRQPGDDVGSTSNPDDSKWGSRKKPLFYVKDGKNYSYKVDGSVAVANYNEAKLVNQVQKELIHGLGRGGNIPLGHVKKLEELNDEQSDGHLPDEAEGRRNQGTYRGRGRRGFLPGATTRQVESNEEQIDGRDNLGVRGRGRRGNRGGGRNHYRQDRAMRKHLSGMPGHFT